MSDVPRHTTIINTDERPESIEVRFAPPAGADDGRWFPVLNWLVDSEALARLSPSAAKVLLVLLRHRSRDGTSLPARAVLEVQSGLRKSAVYDALAEIEAAQMARRTAHGAWELFPGRPFALRGAPAPSPSAPRALPAGDSAAADSLSAVAETHSAVADVLLRQKRDDNDRDGAPRPERSAGGSDGDDGGMIEDLGRKENGAFKREDAVRLVRKYSAARIRDALASAHAVKDHGKLRKTVREFVWWFLQNDLPLFREAEAHQAKRERAAALRRLDEVMKPRLADAGELVRSRLALAYRDPRGTIERGGCSVAEALEMDADALFDQVCARAGARIGGGS